MKLSTVYYISFNANLLITESKNQFHKRHFVIGVNLERIKNRQICEMQNQGPQLNNCAPG